SKGVVNCLAYPFRDCGRIFCLGLKDDVSTLDVRLDIPKAKTSAQFAEMVHLDYFLSAYIDASQHRDVSRHALLPIELSLLWVLRTSSGFFGWCSLLAGRRSIAETLDYFRVSASLLKDSFQLSEAMSLSLPDGKPVCFRVSLVFPCYSSNVTVTTNSSGRSELIP